MTLSTGFLNRVVIRGIPFSISLDSRLDGRLVDLLGLQIQFYKSNKKQKEAKKQRRERLVLPFSTARFVYIPLSILHSEVNEHRIFLGLLYLDMTRSTETDCKTLVALCITIVVLFIIWLAVLSLIALYYWRQRIRTRPNRLVQIRNLSIRCTMTQLVSPHDCESKGLGFVPCRVLDKMMFGVGLGSGNFDPKWSK